MVRDAIAQSHTVKETGSTSRSDLTCGPDGVPGKILLLQRTIGNRAVNRMPAVIGENHLAGQRSTAALACNGELFITCLMGSKSLWGVEEWRSGRFKLFSLIKAVPDGCGLPITNRLFCGWDMQEAMWGSASIPKMISEKGGHIAYVPITQERPYR